jgi:uncharacterized protein YukE
VTTTATDNSAQDLFENIRTTANAIEEGDWLDAGVGVAKVAMDIIGLEGDPLGAIGSSGVSWVLGAVSFLREPFDILKGDPGAISSSASSWGGACGDLHETADRYRQASSDQTRSWHGTAADGYRTASNNQADGLSALSQASRGVSQAMQQGGSLLASVRKQVLDLISQAVQQIIQICVDALSKSWMSFGASVALGISRSVQKAVQTGQKLMQAIQKLVQGLQKIVQVVQQIMKVAQSVKQLLETIGGKASGERPQTLSDQQVTTSGAMGSVKHAVDTGPAPTLMRAIAPGYEWEAPPMAGEGVRLAQATVQQPEGPVSQNGWPVNPPRGMRTIPGTDVQVNVADGPAGDVLMYVAEQVHTRVEDVTMDEVGTGEEDDWGHAEREVRGGGAISNHASATAIDLNATRHPLGVRDTFTTAQVEEIDRIMNEVDGVVRWGGDYQNRADEMHFEINASLSEVTAVADRLRAAQPAQ